MGKGVGICPRCGTPSMWEINIDKDTHWSCCGFVKYEMKPLEVMESTKSNIGVRIK